MSKNRNVLLYIGAVYLPDIRPAAHRALSLCKSFRELGYEVVLVGINGDQAHDEPILNTINEYQGFNSYTLPAPKTTPQWFQHVTSIDKFVEIIKHIGVQNIYGIVAADYEVIALLKLHRYCKNNGMYFIADAEEWFERSELPFPKNIIKDVDTFMRMKWIYPNVVRNIICISRYLCNHYHQCVNNVVYIPGTIDISERKWHDLPKYVPNQITTICYAGNPGLNCRKERVDWLIRAGCNLHQSGYPISIRLAGFDQRLFEIQNHDLTRIPGYRETVSYEGFLSHADSLRLITISDYTAIIREDKRLTRAGFPTKLSESFGCGTPVITTASGNVSEYIKEGVTGIVCKSINCESVQEALETALNYRRVDLIEMHDNLKSSPPLQYSDFNNDLFIFMDKLS